MEQSQVRQKAFLCILGWGIVSFGPDIIVSWKNRKDTLNSMMDIIFHHKD